MAEIIDFNKRLQQKQELNKRLTMIELTINATEFLLCDWEKMAKNNRLNDYFKQSLPNLVDQNTKSNFMNDLNQVTTLEINLDLFPMMFSPGTLRNQQIGWLVKFKLGGETISTPELASEAYARCFGILLYLKLKRDALDAGLIK